MKNKNHKNNKNISESIVISGGLLARNSLLNLFGLVISLIIGVVALPFIIQGLGKDRFGLLSIAWVVLGYFTLFDLGLGRATTKFVSGALGRKEHNQVPRIVWTAATAELIFGVIGAIILIILTPLLVERIFNVPYKLITEAKITFYLLSFSIPVVLTSSSFRGVLAAAQRFDLVNAVKIPISCATYILPLIGLVFGLNLPGIVFLIILARAVGLASYIALNLRMIKGLKRYSATLKLFPQLFVFGGWVMVTSIVSPLLIYFDRFLIGSLLSMTALAFYSAPIEMVTRLRIIPTSLTMTLFPAFSTLNNEQNKQRLASVFARSIKYVFIILAPIVLILSLFAHDVLRLWLGVDFANASTSVLQILSLGVLLNSTAYIPFSLLQGIGRPDIPAKFHLIEMPFYIVIAWFFVSKFGITGAAIAWTLRVALDAILLFIASFKSCRLPRNLFSKKGITIMGLAFCILTGIAYGLRVMSDSFPIYIKFIFLIAILFLFGCIVWKKILDNVDKKVFFEIAKRVS